ncbi:FAD-dependent monooxygenase [Altererythrobacter sp. BO-6]|uniref:FAD-dependent oxidoreductase n=1 Tax=Altererythrobacter sp. BO-6 TaxID=2604537 RepID=UPI0013E14643|nr:NAD(P)/FAD-dependent oxidoreductase [Altererythrobacter sp. BO-6]QIG53595.1 FAD-dependent monooxygenase [Altererythrobacter sp. BO-6]
MQEIRTQVVVAGAGPVGTVAAFMLASRGVDVVLLEDGADCALDLRASTFHPPTLEMLERFDITPRLIEMGLKAPVYHFRERRTGEVIDFDMSELADVTRHPYRIQCEQYHLSRMLSQKVREQAGAEVLFNHRVVALEQTSEDVTVYAETPFAILKIRADYLIGADGSNSTVRKWLGTQFAGFTYPEKFLCFTTEEPLEQHIENLAYVNYVSDPEEWMVLLRVPSLWRVLVPASMDAPDEELLADAKKNEVFERLIGKGEEVETQHRTIYRVHQRVAKSFLTGRTALIGDAAHLNNPIGGFGMNSGIHDAFNLGERLIRIYQHGADADTELKAFEHQRRTTTHDFIQAQTIRNMEYLKEGDGQLHARRKAEMAAIRDDPVRRREFLLRQSMIECLEKEKEMS